MKAIIIPILLATVATLSSCAKEEGMATERNRVPSISSADLSAVARARIFFGHQSVGMNIIDGISELAAASGLAAPAFIESKDAPQARGGFFAHALIGENGDPPAKIRDFAAIVRGGMGEAVDVAFMKLCYVDLVRGTDVDALFAEYRTTMAALEREYPRVVFLHVSTPLTTEPAGLKARLKSLLGRNDNIAREKMNGLMRKEYGAGGRFFDLAAVESAAADGRRSVHRSMVGKYYSLVPSYAADSGHLNAAGRAAASASLLGILALVLRK
jgi:hypothetical protein